MKLKITCGWYSGENFRIFEFVIFEKSECVIDIFKIQICKFCFSIWIDRGVV